MGEEIVAFQDLPEQRKRELCPVPAPRSSRWRLASLLVPSIASAVGFFAFAVLAFSFTELRQLPPDFRKALVLIGAFALAFGGEVGTLAAAIEIFRKTGNGGATLAWDWLGLAVSAVATFAAFLLAFAALLGVDATWSDEVKIYGPIALGLLAAADGYVNFVELGLHLAQFDARMHAWEKEYHDWRRWVAAETNWGAPVSAVLAASGRYLDANGSTVTLSPDEALALPSQEVPVTRGLPPEKRRERLLALWRDDPTLTFTDVAAAVGVSRQTISADFRKLRAAGAVRRRDGREVEVADDPT
jgi:hypothetical protein